MAKLEDLSKGDRVGWATSQGKTTGTVVRVMTKPFSIKGTDLKASKDDPKVVVRSEKTGAEAGHKPSALKKLAEKKATAKGSDGKAKASPSKAKDAKAKPKSKDEKPASKAKDAKAKVTSKDEKPAAKAKAKDAKSKDAKSKPKPKATKGPKAR